ncbi:hypothetical protein [Streptomyces fildesensis]|uniref:hypothetical protein n=1 Tax=Streptomyces fildesensis TaxID=375757 RepID=UPI0018DF5928|nr:hypothetical protein [Streptomyces fildesensis]
MYVWAFRKFAVDQLASGISLFMKVVIARIAMAGAAKSSAYAMGNVHRPRVTPRAVVDLVRQMHFMINGAYLRHIPFKSAPVDPKV